MAFPVATFLAILSALQVQISAAEETKCGNQTFKIPGGNFSCDAVTLSDCSCGDKYPQTLPTSRVHGGVETGVNEFPMMAFIINGWQCVGTIISKRFVLTTALCVSWADVPLRVYVGFHFISRLDESPFTQRFGADEVITHEKSMISSRGRSVKYSKYWYNIALVRLDGDIQFNERVGPACLPFKYTEHNFTGSVFTAVGRGNGTDEFSGQLHKVDVNVTSLEFCKSAFPHLPIQSPNICTYSSPKGACFGDVGGPLLYTEPGTGRQFIAAVIVGPSCGIEGRPGIHVNVVPLLQWIMDHTRGVQYCAK